MDNDDPAERPFDTIAETVGDQTAEPLELLGKEIRLEILVALWDAIDPKREIAADPPPPGLWRTALILVPSLY